MTVTMLVLLALAMMLGPVLMIMPSPRQSRIAALREQAAMLGLNVSMAKSPGAVKPDTATYTLNWTQAPKRGVGYSCNLVLLKQASSHGLHFHGIWDYESRKEQHGLTPRQLESMRHYLDQLPSEITGLAVTRQGVSLYWKEHFESLSGSDEMLARITNLLEHLAGSVINP